MNCDSWFDQRGEVMDALAKELKQKLPPRQVKLKTHTRKRGVQTAEVILYSKYEEVAPIVIAKHPTKRNKFLVSGAE